MITKRGLDKFEERNYPRMIINCLNKKKNKYHSCEFDDIIEVELKNDDVFITFRNLKVVTFKNFMKNISNGQFLQKELGDVKFKWPSRKEGYDRFIKV